MRHLALLFFVACGTKAQTQPPTTVAASSAPSTKPEIPTVTPSTCSADSDCVVSDFTDCCAPCPGTPRAMTHFDLERRRKACTEVECAQQKGRVRCEPTERVDQLRAVCRDRTCEIERSAPQAVDVLTSSDACANDGDCLVSNWPGCCSSCPANAYATSQKQFEARNRVCAAVDCAMPTRMCSPAVDASLYRATCRAGTCAGVKK